MIGIVFIILIFVCYPLLKSIVNSGNKGVAKSVTNITEGAANATNAMPSMGAAFSASQIADTLTELPTLKAAVGCTDDNVRTVIQLQNWMQDNGMM